MYSCYGKADFSESLLQSSVSHDPPEIIIICWFGAQDLVLSGNHNILLLESTLKLAFTQTWQKLERVWKHENILVILWDASNYISTHCSFWRMKYTLLIIYLKVRSNICTYHSCLDDIFPTGVFGAAHLPEVIASTHHSVGWKRIC